MPTPPSEPPLAGRSALVTGGGRGLGAAVARELARSGAAVAVVARSPDEVEAVAEEVGGTGIVADLADPEGAEATVAQAGSVDVVVANAGVIWPLGPFADTDIGEWEQAVRINLFGVSRIVRGMLPGMVDRGWGRIVTISSGAARPPGMPSANAYSTSKAALDMFTLHLARELDGTGVTVNAVRPGLVDTAMQDFMRAQPVERVGTEFHERFHSAHAGGELVDPQDSARFVVDVVLGGRTGEVLDIRDPR